MFLEKMFGLQGKTALVTGGGQGIGQVVAIGLAKAGAKVVIMNRGNVEDTVRMILADGGTAMGVRADVTVPGEVDAALKLVMETYGSLDIVINNAGICMHQSTLDMTPEDFRRVIDVNLTGTFIVSRAAGRIMIDRGIRGNIVNMASMSGSIVNIPQWQCSYNASKAGVIHLTKSLAMEWVGHGIRVNSISPGYIATPMSTENPSEMNEAFIKLIPMHRMGEARELVPTILSMVSDASGYTTGSDFIVDGGYTCL
ncbi:MAG: SDR family oxidoreductase [Eubacteriales bacterium]|jgi:NAD(P)-dependent dehydrogenase (short-subunit alcohol dehydrogenase family)|nr:SDR family oxidoreductase [Eubacteriales bacterium]MDD4711491.1 SDR family oxidoreductase [Eubacteriales bacterium]